MNNAGKKIVLITTGQPATNPRLVKEANSLADAGYEVTVLYCFVISWATAFDTHLLSSVNWRFHCIGGSPEKRKGLYLVTRIRYRLARLINSFTKGGFLAERAEARAFDELLHAAKRIKADIYIGHNLGALPVAVKAATYHNAQSGFDFEDYHRGELAVSNKNRKRIIWLEKKYLAHLAYYSGSSPMITAAVAKDHPGLRAHSITLLNCFPYKELACMQPDQEQRPTLKLFWFSQTVGLNRGLETVIKALKILNNKNIQLTLAGRCATGMQAFLINLAGHSGKQLHFAGTIAPDDLIAFAAGQDIGLACEISEPLNRNMCLTNKIFSYLNAGLCIIASKTVAQEWFFKQYPSIAFLYEADDPVALSQTISYLFENRLVLSAYKKNSCELAKNKLNWQKEQVKVTNVIKQVFDNDIK